MKETQRQYIIRLEKELQQAKSDLEEYKALCNNLNAEILVMQERADKDYSNSSDYIQMQKHIDFLESKNKSLDETIKHDENIKKLISESKHNERGAGRKSRFTDSEKETIKVYRLQGKTIKEIADIYNCSVGLIHKLINENNNK